MIVIHADILSLRHGLSSWGLLTMINEPSVVLVDQHGSLPCCQESSLLQDDDASVLRSFWSLT